MTKRFNAILLATIIAVGIPFYWFFLESGNADPSPKNLNINQLRAAANRLPGPHPYMIRYERVGHRYFVRNLLAAGTGLRPTPYAIVAYEMLIPGGGSIMIDAGTTKHQALQNGIENFDAAAQARVDAAYQRTNLKINLVDHPLHDGGRNGDKFVPKRSVSPPSADRKVAMNSVAPGVVTIDMPGLTRGSRMVYVQLADGRELLFTGDVAPIMESWKEVRPPSRYSTTWSRPQDRDQIASWLETISDLRKVNPALVVVAAHDFKPPRPIDGDMKPLPSMALIGKSGGSGQGSPR